MEHKDYNVEVGTANFDANAVTRHSREKYIESNLDRKYKHMSQSEQKKVLGEIYDACAKKVAENEPAEPATEPAKGKDKDKAPAKP